MIPVKYWILLALFFGYPLEAKEVVLLYTGNTQGFLEVCGCSDNQLGGVARRAALLRDLRHKYPQAIVADAGGLFAGDGALDQLRCAVHLDALRAMAYDVAHIDVGAYRFGSDFLKTMRDTAGVPFINANLQVAGSALGVPFRVIEREGVRVGFIGVGAEVESADDHAMGMHGGAKITSEVEVFDAIASVKTAVKKVGPVDALVVLSDLKPETEVALVNAVLDVDVVISVRREETIVKEQQALLLGTQPQGKAVGIAVLDLVDGKIVDHRVLSAFVSETIGEDARVKSLVDGFYDRVAESPALQMVGTPRFVGYALEQKVIMGHNRYVGAETCATCHVKEHADWLETPHAHAFQRLLQQQKHVQPDCVPCHTTGFGFETGFRIGRDHESLTNVQCEVCHGPGDLHVRRPEKSNIRRTPTPDLCQQCHDADQTPDFETQFPHMLAEITHHGQGNQKPSLQVALENSTDGKPVVELFVMADCPYGKRAEMVLAPVIQRLGDQINFRLHFIADEVGVDDVAPTSAKQRRSPGCSGETTGTGRFRSLHGDAEVDEGVRQLVIAQLYPDQLWAYILCRNEAGADWRNCALKLGLDVSKIESMANGDTGASLFSENIRRANLLGIHASPTLLVNGQEVEAFSDPIALTRAICATDTSLKMCEDLPQCRNDQDCEVAGQIGVCVNANTPQAHCEVHTPVAFPIQILNDSSCTVCETHSFVRSTLALFPGAAFETVDVNTPEGQILKSKYGLDRVPSFVLGAEFEKTARFNRFIRTVTRVGDGFVPDVRMTGVAKVFTDVDTTGLDAFLDLTRPSSIRLVESLVQWRQSLQAPVRLHFVGQGDADRLFQRAFELGEQRAWDALLAFVWGQRERRSDLSAEVCLRQAGFALLALHGGSEHLSGRLAWMHTLSGRRDMVPFVVLDGQVMVSGVGLSRGDVVYRQMHAQ